MTYAKKNSERENDRTQISSAFQLRNFKTQKREQKFDRAPVLMNESGDASFHCSDST